MFGDDAAVDPPVPRPSDESGVFTIDTRFSAIETRVAHFATQHRTPFTSWMSRFEEEGCSGMFVFLNT